MDAKEVLRRITEKVTADKTDPEQKSMIENVLAKRGGPIFEKIARGSYDLSPAAAVTDDLLEAVAKTLCPPDVSPDSPDSKLYRLSRRDVFLGGRVGHHLITEDSLCLRLSRLHRSKLDHCLRQIGPNRFVTLWTLLQDCIDFRPNGSGGLDAIHRSLQFGLGGPTARGISLSVVRALRNDIFFSLFSLIGYADAADFESLNRIIPVLDLLPHSLITPLPSASELGAPALTA